MKKANGNTNLARRGGLLAVAVIFTLAGLLPATPAFAHGDKIIPSGTTMRIRVETPIRSGSVDVGTPFMARVTRPVIAGDVEGIPADTMVMGRVVGISQGKAAWGQPSGVTIAIESLKSPTGVTVNVIGDLIDGSGVLLNTIDNLATGTEIAFRTSRALTVGEAFYMLDGGDGGDDQGSDVFNTTGTVTQAQTILRDLGYYNGAVDGRLTAGTRTAIGLFQRDNRLQQTGFLDRNTVDRLGLIGTSGQEVQAVTVLSADAMMHSNNELHVRIVAQTSAAGWQVFEDHFRQRDTLHVYLRGFRPGGFGAQVLTSKEVSIALPREEWQGLNRIVIHGAGRDITIMSNNFDQGSNAMTPQEAAALEAQVARTLSEYAKALGVRYNLFNGQLVLTRANYTENEIELLFALNSLASSAKLYTQILRSTTDPQAIEGATDLFVAQANMVDRAVSRTRSGRAASVARSWATLRTEFAGLDSSDRTNTDGVGYRP